MTGRKPPTFDLAPLGGDRESYRARNPRQDFWQPAGADLDAPALYDGVLMRRSLAFILDMVIATILSSVLMLATCAAAFTATIFTFGLISVPVLLLPAMIVHGVFATFMIAGDRAGTWGMRAFGLQVVRQDGGRVDSIQAFMMVAMYFASTAILFPVLVVGLFTARNRLLHDLVAGTLVLRRAPV